MRRRTTVIALGVLAAAGLAGWWRFRVAGFGQHVYRIGWMISPPFQVRGPDGKEAGLSVELVKEAARRRGISLQWIFWPDSSESALKSKSVDLWPLITITPERLKAFHISEPYLQHEHCLLVRNDSQYKRIEDVSTARVGISNAAIDTVLLKRLLPAATPLFRPLITEVLEDTCGGHADAAFMDKYTAISALMEMPACGGHTLRWIGVPQIRSRLGVGATFESRAAADAIREEIGAMAEEGRLASIFGQWGVMSGEDVESVEALLDARRRETRLAIATALFASLFGLTCWQTIRLVRERTRTRQAQAELRDSQERYMQAQKLESIGRLAGGVAHDFNNLLTVINGYSEIVLGKLEAGHPARQHVKEIRKAGERAASLTQQLLAFGRKQMIRPRPIDLNSVVRECEKMFSRLLGEDIELIARLGTGPAMTLADPGQINQVLMNLVVNARDAMPDGGRLIIETDVVEVDTQSAAGRPEVTPGPAVRLTVSDNGHGMDESTREHIFEPFFTTKGLAQGTGLGLATVYGIVKQSHGWIRVQSEPGKGSSFEIYLPRIAGTDAVPESADAGPPPSGSETLLVVEDQEEVRAFAVSALAAFGYHVLNAADADEALELSQRYPGPIHLLVTDVVLPTMNGRELAERMKAARSEVAVLYTSGYTADVIAHRGVLDQDLAFLPKPYTAEAIAGKVREMLKRS